MRSSLKLRSGCAERAEQKCNRRNLLEPDIEVIDDGDALADRHLGRLARLQDEDHLVVLEGQRLLASAAVVRSPVRNFSTQHDRLLTHKQAAFDHLVGRWRDLFNISYDVLLYDLTSIYFEADPPFPEGDKRRFGYSRDHRPDCVQIVIALVVTPEGLPLAYEVLPGNTAARTTLRPFLEHIERQYGKARRVWLMERGIPTEEVLYDAENHGELPAVLAGTRPFRS
jgi:hypothetical protein